MGKPLNPKYRLYHPKWYRSRIPIFWWLGKLSYTKFIGRELTSVLVAYSAMLLLFQVWVLSRGELAYEQFLAILGSRPVVILHSLLLAGLLFHTITWLNLAPRALVMRIAGRRVPDALVLVGHYVAWASATAFVAWFLLRG